MSTSSRQPSPPTTEELLAQQVAAIRQQDHELDALSHTISEVQGTASTIGETANLHVRLLNELEDDVEEGTRSIDRESERLALVQKRAETRSLWFAIMVLAGILVVMILLKVG